MSDLVASVYPWQLAQWEKLNELVARDRLPHALLLSGPRHVGKQQFADVLAQGLLCSEPLAGYACGRCKHCHLLAAQSYPDLLYVEPEEERKPIKIDAIRELGEFLGKTAQQGSWKVAVISPAENMNTNAANALLKNLEEPKGKTLLLLVSHNPSRLPATIRSRCRILKFATPERAKVLPWLQQVLPERNDHQTLLQQAGGRPLWALKLLETGLLEEQQGLEQVMLEVSRRDVTPLEAAAVCMKLDDLTALDWLQSFVLKCIQEDNALRKMRLFQYLDRLQSAKKVFLSPSNPNRQLVWEELMLDWQMYSVIDR